VLHSCKVSLVITGLFLTVNANALDFESARTTGLSGSGRGGPLMTDTIFVNPSALAFQNVQALSGTFDWLTNPASPPGTTNHLFNGSVVDGKNQYVDAGLAFTRRPDLDLIHLALAKQVMPWGAIGATVKRFSSGSANPQSINQVTGFDGGLSAAVVIPADMLASPQVSFGLTAENLIHDAAKEATIGPRQLGGGVKATFEKLLALYADAVVNQSNVSGAWTTYSGGAEIGLGSDFYIRGGLSGYRQKGWSYGVGWTGPKIAINYGFQNAHLDALRSIDHVITIDIFM
jgi:hypothetical protein